MSLEPAGSPGTPPAARHRTSSRGLVVLEDAGQADRTQVVQRGSQELDWAGLVGERVEAEVLAVAGGGLGQPHLRTKVVTTELVIVVETCRVLNQLLCQEPVQEACNRRCQTGDLESRD